MKVLLIIAFFSLFIYSCNTVDSNANAVSIDSTGVFGSAKDEDEIFSKVELNAIYENLLSSPLKELPKQWEMLTEKKKALIVLIPGGGDNTRFSIAESNSTFILTLNGMHDAVEYLITDCKQNGNETTITYYTTTTWTKENRFDEVVTEREPLYANLVLKKVANKQAVILCNYPKNNTYYVSAEHIKDFPKEEEPSPYDEGVDLSVDSASKR